jgi:hypothetical protein
MLSTALCLAMLSLAVEGQERGDEGDEQELPQVKAVETSGSVLSEALRQLGAMRSSSYTHTTRIDEASGTFDYDCSGLIDYSLARVAPGALHELQQATVRRPLAKHFVRFISSLPNGGKSGRWRRVESARDLRPGDIVAWLKPDDVTTKNTGHVMIVRGPVSRDRSGQIAVPVIDSTSVRHGTGDSRYRTQSTGLGTGTMYLTVDAHGAPRGYLWSHGSKSHEHATTIALGRVE